MYYLVYAIFYLLSLLPWFIIYLISDGCYFLVYYVFKYRREVVANNLLIAFPEKTDSERVIIAKQFYRNFTETFVEAIKLLSISKSEMKKRFAFDVTHLKLLTDNHPKINLVSGHYFNWEFANLSISLQSDLPFMGVYKPLSNKIFNRLMLSLRSKFGTILLASNNFRADFRTHSKGNYILGLVGDQNANDTSKAFWIDFFGKKVPFVKGPENGSKLYNTAIVYAYFHKVKRGYYSAYFELITDKPNSYKEGDLTKILIKKIEDSIRQEPSNYLWTHRRWKHVFNPEHHAHLAVD